MSPQDSTLSSRRDEAKIRAYAQRSHAGFLRTFHTALLYGVPIFAFLGSTTLVSGLVTTGEFNYVPLAGACSLMAGLGSVVLNVQDLEAIAKTREDAASKYDKLWQDIDGAMELPVPPASTEFTGRMQKIAADVPSANGWLYRRAAKRVASGEYR